MNQRIEIARVQHGQAMVEFLVAALFFLVPLFLAMSAIGKLIDVQHTANMAARYAAWERTVWYEDGGTSPDFKSFNNPNQKTTGEIRNEIALRLLNDHSSGVTVIKNTDKSATSFSNGLDPMWHDPSNTAYLDDYAQLSLSINNEKPKNDIAGGALVILKKVEDLLPAPVKISILPPLPLDTLAVAHITLGKVAKSSITYQRLWSDLPWLGLDFESTAAILSNTWSANSAQGTTAMVKQSVPSARGPLNLALEAAKIGILPWDPIAVSGGRLDVGKIAVDEVPPDRLK